ncbi:hypothetical protein E0H73_04625 [Kribbella pittospori]|uniref:ORC1/DEAH AAA+ ATPase domain-containing protein n=1 Tax=Kribbella pittospori TaxID=722689 RepID=A0A4R0L236_9ACTN|nr:AAA family ATPase [Kribbella pittospori]TCC66194.1 hypothetical protein E0H73_04625 [Kribbella pittospori]
MGTLPAELTSFVGRRQELRDIRALLATGRLVTLTGPGGVGKTRLGLRTAAQLRRTFPDGVWLTELAAVRDPAELPRTIGSTLGLRDADDDPIARLTEFIEDRSLLLVLDNCEHLHDSCADLVRRLLKAAPGLRVLATSRHVLGVDGEHVYAVRPLPAAVVSGLSGAVEQDAVKLFADRAAAVSAGFRVTEGNWAQIVEIARRLDGIPLAVELAAAWMRVLSVDDLLDRMDTLAPGRQQILDWSYGLCSDAERTLWARLSVFIGGFDLAGAEAVGAADLSVLSGLVDKSIVQSDGGLGTGRFQLLETIREYGLEKLRSEEDVVRARHRDHYLRLAERYGRDWSRGDAQAEAHARTRPEHANLRSALEFSLTTPGQEAVGLRLAVALHYHWLFCGHSAEGRRWLELALERNPAPSRDRAQALWIAAFALSLMGYPSTIYSYGHEAEAWARENGDDEVLAYALLVIGGYWFLSGEVEKAEPLFQQAIGQLEARGEPSSLLLQLHASAAQVQTWEGHPERGLALARLGLEQCDASGEQFARSNLLFARSLAQWRLGAYREAAEGLTEAIRLAQTFNDVLGAVTWLELLCWTTAAMGSTHALPSCWVSRTSSGRWVAGVQCSAGCT